MLTGRSSPPRTPRRPTRSPLLSPTARLAHPGLVLLTVALGAVPTLLTLALGGNDLFAPLVLAGVVSGAALGWAVEDPSAELLASTPSGAPVRTVIRAAAAALLAATGFLALLAAVAVGPGLPPRVGDRWPEAAAAATAALAFGLLAARRGDRAPGAGAVTAGVLATAFVAGLSFKLRDLPSFLTGPHHGRWWLTALLALAIAVHAGRDPARR